MNHYHFLCVDDEKLSLSLLQKVCMQQNPNNSVVCCNNGNDALRYAEKHCIDVALLDIDMPNMTGIELAKRMMQLYPRLNIIIITAYDKYALDAYSQNCSGYLLKPITLDALNNQLKVLRFPTETEPDTSDFTAQCFGNFEVFFRGQPITFAHAMTKELLAYLIDRKGALCSNRQISAVLWEDDKDHTPYFKVLKKDLIDTVEKLSDSPLMIVTRGFLGLNNDYLTCDYYQYLAGNRHLFIGEYMEQYSWAEITKSNLIYQHSDIS